MEPFTIKIAGKTMQVHPLFESTRYYCRHYLTEEPPMHALTVTRQALEGEQAALRGEALEEGLKPRVFPDPFLERSCIQRRLAEIWLGYDILMLHGSTVAVDGEAYLFTANCGTGKSTHTRLWREVFGERAVMINDDKPFLRWEKDQVLACGAPWSGKHGLDTNLTAPLKGICILERGRENVIAPMTPAQALPMLEKQAAAPEDPEKRQMFLSLVRKLSLSVPLWRMQCNKDPEAANVAYRAMGARE